MKSKLTSVLLATLFASSASLATLTEVNAQQLRVFIRAGKKTHGPGAHDHPRFLTDWTKLLNARGAKATGALSFPSAEALAKTDVLVMYAANAGDITGKHRTDFIAYLKRGGGIVVIHDAVCGHDPHWFKTVIGGAWEHRHSKWYEGDVGLYYTRENHPITRGASNFFFDDEIYFKLHMMPEARVLARAFHSIHDLAPQMWVYEKDDYRAFVSIPGHKHKNFNQPHHRAILLRGIAWAGKRDADSLVTADELASLRYPTGGPLRPEQAHAKIQPQPKFDIELVAAEPLVENPIAIDWDNRGRLWVAETPEYPFHDNEAAPPRDRIAVLEDRDGDGRMENKQVFAGGLNLVTGMVLHRDGVIVAQAPVILWLRDTNGDGKADRRETLYANLGHRDTHAVINNLRWGLDGWVYATHGYSGGRVTSGDGKKQFGTIGSGVVRFRPDGSAFEQVCSKNGNTWGLAIDWDGEIFFTQATSGDHLNHVVMSETALSRGRVRGTRSPGVMNDHRKSFTLMNYKKAAYVQIDQVGGFTAAAGGAVYNGGAWPAEYDGMYFMGEPTINIVHRDVIRPHGVTFTASRDETDKDSEFIMGTDLWFRPIDVRIGPDGAMYVVDFSNQAVIHNDTRRPPHSPRSNAAVRPDRNHDLGRIWRVHHKLAKKLEAPPFFASSPAKPASLVAALSHPALQVRMTAHRLLLESKAAGSVPALASLLTEGSPAARIHALWILCETNNLQPAQLQAVWSTTNTKSKMNTAIVKNLMLVAGVLQARSTARLDRETKHVLRAGLAHHDARVRLLTVLALQEADSIAEFAADLVGLFANSKDSWTRSAVAGASHGDPLLFARQILAASGDAKGDFLTLLSEQVADAAKPDQAAALVQLVATQPAARHRAVQVVLATLHARLPPAVVAPFSADLQAALRTLLASKQSAVVSATLPFVKRWDRDRVLRSEVGPRLASMVAQLGDSSTPPPRQAALAVDLLAMRDLNATILPALARLLVADPTPKTTRVQLIAAMGRTADQDVGTVLATAYPKLPPGLRDQAMGLILKREAWTMTLLDLVESAAIRHATLTPTTVHRLRTHGRPAVARRANQLIAKLRGPAATARIALIEKFATAVRAPGDPVRGKALFASACGTCHRFHKTGKKVGPDLTGMGAHGPIDLLTHVIDPNRAVEPNYIAHSVETKNGAAHTGIIVSENRGTLVLRHVDGDVEIPKRDIRNRRSTGLSLMPEQLGVLGADVLRDVFAYMTSLDGKRFRIIDLSKAFSADSRTDVFAGTSRQAAWSFQKFGTINVDGVPFKVVNPAANATGWNTIVLKGGPDRAASKSRPQKADFDVGFRANTLHFLGGVAGWGYPFGGDRLHKVRAMQATVHFADGNPETHVFRNGREFADYIGRHDVPGSRFVPGLTGTRQVRWFTVPLSREGVITRVELSSFDNHVATTTFAVTAELADAKTVQQRQAAARRRAGPRKFNWGAGTRALIVGGGSSHDFDRWFKREDTAILNASPGAASVRYTDRPQDILAALPEIDVLYLSNNKAIPSQAVRQAIMEFADRGKGLVLVHAALWYNWRDWPEYNRGIVGGGSRGHDRYGEFEVEVTAGEHPVMAGVPAKFRIKDELYRHEVDPKGTAMEVLAQATSPKSKITFPIVWVVKHKKARIVCITLGHDGASHQLPAFRRLLQNAVKWASGK